MVVDTGINGDAERKRVAVALGKYYGHRAPPARNATDKGLLPVAAAVT